MLMKFILLLVNMSMAMGFYICQDGLPIARYKLCNGQKDCKDGSDETIKLCFHLICPRNKFRCQYGGCVDGKSRCNSTIECADGSDETYCYSNETCSQSQFECLSEGKCIEENLVCNGVSDCSDDSDESVGLCEGPPCPRYTFRCRHGGCIYDDLLCDKYLHCPDGSDESTPLCDYLKCKMYDNCTNNLSKYGFCRPIKHETLDVTCTLKEFGDMSCNSGIPIGATARLQCREFYMSTNKYDTELQCQLNGNWNGNVLKCTAECGKMDPDVIPLIVNGRSITNWPWHAIMYLLKDGKWISACGGTLISEIMVLTAAHCTWKKSVTHLKFAFGKYYSDYDTVDIFTQIRDVHRIYTPTEYLDYRSNYGSDIAAVILSKPVEFSRYVKPACLDWHLSNIHHHLTDNNTGTIAGVGLTANDVSSKKLQALRIPIVSPTRCIQNQERDFKKYVTYTTFCAGWANGTSVCNGDSGGGLLFQDVADSDRWILQGLVSVSPRRKGSNLCDSFRYVIFTKIALYLNWLRHIISTEL